MPTATLLLREPAITSLTSIVEKSQSCSPPFPEYDLRLNSCQVDFVLISGTECRGIKVTTTDEGFESDTASIISSDDSFTSGNQDNCLKSQETDSANGSASSDSDTEVSHLEPPKINTSSNINNSVNERYLLVDCMCYSDIKFPNILLFVVKGDVFVFRFSNLDNLKSFYTSFSTFKAIANQRVLTRNVGAKFNLLHRTDRNGITHIEIKKEPLETRLTVPQKCEPSNIISLNTPETNAFYTRRPKASMSDELQATPFNTHKESRSSLKDANLRQRSESPAFINIQSRKECIKNSYNSKVAQKSASIENILDLTSLSRSENKKLSSGNPESMLKKVWNSAEDLLDAPVRPERRRKLKPRAPPPPDVLQGQYVRVNVSPTDIKSSVKENISLFQNLTQRVLPVRDFSLTLSYKPKELTFQQFKFVEPKRMVDAVQSRINSEHSSSPSSWTNSVPRFLRKPRSQSETRNFTPMAYRYIDTTHNYFNPKQDSTVSNRLFGLSSKLKDFGTVSSSTLNRKYDNWQNMDKNENRRNSLGEINYKINSGGSLKSVIKKDENKRRNNEKKVTFSAYTTVQVV